MMPDKGGRKARHYESLTNQKSSGEVYPRLRRTRHRRQPFTRNTLIIFHLPAD